ncbi:MAG: tetratricopeptide repeat protein [Mycobacterium sp.]
MLAQLGRRDRGTKIRILILERQARGVWWESTLRRGRLEESLNIDKTMYALPRQLGGLDRDAFCVVIKTTAEQLGHGNLTSTQIEDIADRAEEIDLDGRPLLIQVATLDWLHRTTGSGGRDATLRRLIGRSVVQLRERIGDDSIATLANNAQVFTTALGGLTVENYARVLSGFTQPATLLPDVFQVMGSVTLDHLVDGVRPDSLGELFVLDQLDVEGVTRLSTISLMTFAARVDQDAYHGFVERAAADHAEHPRLRDLLAAAWSDEAPAVGAELATATIPLLKRSDHPVIAWIFEQLNGISDQLSPDTARRLSATARFRIANLVFGEGDHTRACSDFTEALALCDPAWPERGNILNNRGIVQLELGRLDLAIADFSLVIDTTTTSNEARACALNNRADVFRDSGDLASSIADRTAVLALDNTTYNRRYIAFARRALAFQQIGDHGGAFRDIAAILGTSDIAAEQKMSARLMRAEWLLDAGEVEAGRRDLDAILASRRNFDAVEHKARELRRWRPVRG